MQQDKADGNRGISADRCFVRAFPAGHRGQPVHQRRGGTGRGHAAVPHRHGTVRRCPEPPETPRVPWGQPADRPDGPGRSRAHHLAGRSQPAQRHLLGLSRGPVLFGHRPADLPAKRHHQHADGAPVPGHPRFSGHHGRAHDALCAPAVRAFPHGSPGHAAFGAEGRGHPRGRAAGRASGPQPFHGSGHAHPFARAALPFHAGNLFRHGPADPQPGPFPFAGGLSGGPHAGPLPVQHERHLGHHALP